MKQINDLLVGNLGPLGPLIAVGVLGLLLMLVALPVMLKKQVDPLTKLREATRPTLVEPKAKKSAVKSKQGLRMASGSDKLDKFAGFLEPKTEEEMSTARMKMTRAGYRGRNSVRTFHAIQFILGIFFLICGVIYAIISSANGEVSTTSLILAVVVPGAVGYYLPKYWVDRRIQSRQDEIQNGFPDALDMLLVCVEAGQSLDRDHPRVQGIGSGLSGACGRA